MKCRSSFNYILICVDGFKSVKYFKKNTFVQIVGPKIEISKTIARCKNENYGILSSAGTLKCLSC